MKGREPIGPPTFTSQNVTKLHNVSFRSYRKKTETLIADVQGPFACLTRDGYVHCEDGYLAIDTHGYPYPLAREEFAVSYEPVNGN